MLLSAGASDSSLIDLLVDGNTFTGAVRQEELLNRKAKLNSQSCKMLSEPK